MKKNAGKWEQGDITYPAWRIVHGESIPWLDAGELLFLALEQFGQNLR